MRPIAAVSASLVLWASSASAGPGVIVARRVQAFDAPSESASAVAELGHGATVLVLDEESHAGVVQCRPGWLAIRLPGSGGVGYVHTEDVELATTSGIADPFCRESATVLERPATAPATAPLAPHPSEAPASVPPPVQARTPLLAGGFLPLRPARLVLGLGSGAAWLREQSAAQHHIGSSGVTINTTLGLTIYDIFSISASGGAAFPSDDESFSQDVVPEQGGGDPTTADSSLEVARYSIAVGLRTPFWALSPPEKGWFAGALFADYGWSTIHGRRSITDCTDCRSDDLDFRAAPSGASASIWPRCTRPSMATASPSPTSTTKQAPG